MGEEFIGQLTHNYRALKLVSGVLLLFALVPGMPTLPFVIISGILFTISRSMGQVSSEETVVAGKPGKPGLASGNMAAVGAGASSGEPSLDTPEEVQALLPLDSEVDVQRKIPVPGRQKGQLRHAMYSSVCQIY